MPTPTYTYNIQQLLREAFGIVGVRSAYNQPLPSKHGVSGYNEIPSIELNEQTATSYLGTPIVMPVAFDEVKWTEIINGEKKEKSLPQITMPPATLIDFSQAKVIEKTRIAGRNGTVKEYIGMDDWSIRLRGIIINEEKDEAPEETIKLIKNLKNCPVAIRILNPMCLWLDIYNVVVEDIDFPSLEGYPGAQPYTMNLSSDEIFELKYKNGL
ncbi:MAG: DUF6046 domain-containing protein [Bacteroidia bacterium]|nr:DUF6046 domain-containing protein [Bacteroidia bacterium]